MKSNAVLLLLQEYHRPMCFFIWIIKLKSGLYKYINYMLYKFAPICRNPPMERNFGFGSEERAQIELFFCETQKKMFFKQVLILNVLFDKLS